MEKFGQTENNLSNLNETEKKTTRRDFLQFMLKASLVGGVALLTRDFNTFTRTDVKNKSEKPISKEGNKPIFACIIDSEKIDKETNKMLIEMECYDRSTHVSAESNYMISSCDNKDKFSEGYFDCNGVVIVGESKESNSTQISILTHQDPKQFLGKDKERFINDLRKSLCAMKAQSKEASLSALAFGGAEGDKNYIESIKLLGEIIQEELGFEPVVATGPNMRTGKGSTRVYFDTQNRRLYIVRPAHDSEFNESYLPSEIKKQDKKWRTKEED